MIKRVLKFGTGEIIPEGAIYLCTKQNGVIDSERNIKFVWHYFLVECEDAEVTK